MFKKKINFINLPVDHFVKEFPNASSFHQNSFIFEKLAFIMESVRPLLKFQQQPQSTRKRPRVDSTDEQNLPKKFKMDSASYKTIITNAYGEFPVGTNEVGFKIQGNFFRILIKTIFFYL